MARFPSHRNPQDLQLEVCEVHGGRRPRRRLHVLQIEGMRGVVACDDCLKGSLKQPGFRDYIAFSGRPAQQIPERSQPYGGSNWIEEEAG